MDEQTNPVNTQQTSSEAEGTVSKTKGDIRDKAITALLPLVDGLEAPPSRKFEILMTAARTTDDDSILQKALETAILIEDPSEKAEALLDLINETNL